MLHDTSGTASCLGARGLYQQSATHGGGPETNTETKFLLLLQRQGSLPLFSHFARQANHRPWCATKHVQGLHPSRGGFLFRDSLLPRGAFPYCWGSRRRTRNNVDKRGVVRCPYGQLSGLFSDGLVLCFIGENGLQQRQQAAIKDKVIQSTHFHLACVRIRR